MKENGRYGNYGSSNKTKWRMRNNRQKDDRTAASSSAGLAEVSGQQNVREVGQHWHVTGPWPSKVWQVTRAVDFLG